MRTTSVNPWVVRLTPREEARVGLLCFPHAGGGTSLWRPWSTSPGLPAWVEVAAIQLPGHGSRGGEPLVTESEHLVEALVQAVLPLAGEGLPLALFGHSLGGLLAFEVARRLSRVRMKPFLLAIAACRAPQLPERLTGIPDDETLTRALRAARTQPEALAGKLALLRAGYALRLSYHYRPAEPLPCPLIVYGGREDNEVTPAELCGWGEQAPERFQLRMFPGGHFFLHEASVRPRVVQKLGKALAREDAQSSSSSIERRQ
jgi:medium-chain acyl-[acyl-carrier-protein] hydrolase